MGYQIAILAPIRMLTSISHITISALILMNKEWNTTSCQVDTTRKDFELTIALSLIIGLACLELIGLLIGTSVNSYLQNLICIGFHFAGAVSLLFFMFNRNCSDSIWPIFATCSCITFCTELLTIIRVLVARSLLM